MTRGELIEILQSDNHPLDTPVNIYLECTNNDAGIYGNITGLFYDKRFKNLTLDGNYEQEY